MLAGFAERGLGRQPAAAGVHARKRHPPGYGAAREAVSRIPSRPTGGKSFQRSLTAGLCPTKIGGASSGGGGSPTYNRRRRKIGRPRPPPSGA